MTTSTCSQVWATYPMSSSFPSSTAAPLNNSWFTSHLLLLATRTYLLYRCLWVSACDHFRWSKHTRFDSSASLPVAVHCALTRRLFVVMCRSAGYRRQGCGSATARCRPFGECIVHRARLTVCVCVCVFGWLRSGSGCAKRRGSRTVGRSAGSRCGKMNRGESRSGRSRSASGSGICTNKRTKVRRHITQGPA